jgi:hypothetical protein
LLIGVAHVGGRQGGPVLELSLTAAAEVPLRPMFG